MEGRHFPESVYVEGFISGLKEDIKPFVIAFNPSTLIETYELALQMELAFDIAKKVKGS